MKRLFYAVVVILLVGILWKLYTGVNGSPIKKQKAEEIMTAYLMENYPGKDFKIGKVYYSMSFGSYTTTVTSSKDSSVSFMLTYRSGNKINYDEYIYKYEKDEELSRRLGEEAKKEIEPMLKANIPNFSDATAELFVKKGEYESTKSFSKDMPEKLTVWVYLKGEKISKEAFVENCIKARDLIQNQGYKVECFSFHYGTSFKGDVKGDGKELYSFSIRDKQLKASAEELLKEDEIYENKGKGRMIIGAALYKWVIGLFISGVLAAGTVIVIKEKANKSNNVGK